MERFKRFVIGLLISLFILPLQLVPAEFSYAKEAPPAKDTSSSQVTLPPKEGKAEMTENRTEYTKTFIKSDGSKELDSYLEPVHYKDSSNGGAWTEIDSSLKVDTSTFGNGSNSGYANKKNDFKLNLSTDLSQRMFSLTKSNSSIELKPQDILRGVDVNNLNLLSGGIAAKPYTVSGDNISYKNVYSDTDFIIHSMNSGVKEDIVLNRYTGKNIFKFDLNLQNAIFTKNPDGSYDFFNQSDKSFLFKMPRFYMWDSKGGKNNVNNAMSYDVESEITAKNNSYEVTVTADNKFLSDPNRVYPVTIDPSFNTLNDLEDTYIQSTYHDSRYLAWNQARIWVGRQTGAYPYKGLMRAFILFGMPDLTNSRIDSAMFSVLQTGCTGSACSNYVDLYLTSQFNPYDIYWDNASNNTIYPYVDGSGTHPYARAANDTQWGWMNFDVKQAVADMYKGDPNVQRGGFQLFQTDWNQEGWRNWMAKNDPDFGEIGNNNGPRLVVNYNDYNASYAPTAVPEMTASTTVDVPVTIRNTGNVVWTKGQFNLGYHWVNNATAEMSVFEGLRTALPRDVNKGGDQLTVLAKVKAPSNAGDWKLQWDMVQEGVTWFTGQGVPSADMGVNISPPSFASMTHLGTESYYAKVGPVDLATGNLSYSSTDLSVNSPTGGLNIARSYNSNTLDQTYATNADGYIQNWLVNGPYKENNQAVRLTRSYIPNETTVRPSVGSISTRNLWSKSTDTSIPYINFNNSFDQVGTIQNGYATNSAAYTNTYVYSPSDQAAQLRLGSDDGVRAWLNGVLVCSNDIYRGITLDSDVVNVGLKTGWNRLLIKVTQGVGGWNMSARFTDATGKPIPTLKYTLNNPEVFQASKISTKGWSFSFDELLYSSDPENVYYRDGTGTVNIFTKNSDGSYKQPAGTDLKLFKNTDGTYYLQAKYGVKKNFRLDGKIANVIDLLGNKLDYQYNSIGQCIKIVDGTRYINIAYNGGVVGDVTDALGNRILYMYEPSPYGLVGNFWGVVNSLDQIFTYAYSPANGKLSKYQDKIGNVTNIVYVNNKVSQITDALGNATKFNYLDKATEVTDALGRKSIANFNEANILTAFANAKSYKELYGYDSSYHLTSMTPAIAQNDYYFYKWSYLYDANGNLVSESDPTNATSTYVYSGNDLVKATDPKGNISSNTYSTDGKRLLTSSKDAQGNISSYAYDIYGRPVSSTDPKGAITKYTYNLIGDVATVISPNNEVIKYGYDIIGRKTVEVSPLGLSTKFFYDKLSNLTQVVDPAGLKVTYSYDANGNGTSVTYPNLTKKSFTYDKLNRLTTVIDETGAAISYAYDVASNQVSMTDANGKITKYAYDVLNQLTNQTDPTGKTVAVNYDRNGNVASTTDQKGNATTNTYDKSGALTSTQSGGVKSTLSLDPNKNVSKIVTSNGQTTDVAYDKNDNPIQKTSSVLGTETAIYDKTEQAVTAATVTAATNFVRDLNGSISSITATLIKTGTSLGTTTYANDPDGKLRVITKPNADTSTFSYDSSGRVSAISNVNKLGVAQKNYSYTYDLTSNQTAIKDNAGKISSYAYDARNELVTEGTKKYTYDPMGNRKTVTDGTKVTNYAYDTVGDANRLLKATYSDGRTVSYEYDSNGNIIKETDSKIGITTYAYDSDNYFTQATLPDKTIVQYTYDQVTKLRSQRILTTPSGVKTTTKFVFSGNRLVSETDAAGNVLKNYTWDEQENLISFTIPVADIMTTYYYVKNAKGDVVGLSDKDGKMVVAYEYDAWGNILTAKNLVATGIPSDLYLQNPRLYGSYWYDSALGLYFMKTRMYDPELGRFMSKDQVSGGGGSALDFNPYLYCNNNPVSRIDLDGKSWWSKVTNAVSNAYHWVAKEVSAAVSFVVNVATKAWNGFSNVVNTTVNYYAGSNNKYVRGVANAVNNSADKYGGNWGSALKAGLVFGVVATGAIWGLAAAIGAGITVATVAYEAATAAAILNIVIESVGGAYIIDNIVTQSTMSNYTVTPYAAGRMAEYGVSMSQVAGAINYGQAYGSTKYIGQTIYWDGRIFVATAGNIIINAHTWTKEAAHWIIK